MLETTNVIRGLKQAPSREPHAPRKVCFLLVLACLLTLLTPVRVAAAEEHAKKSVEACFDAYEQTQIALKAEDPITAKEKAEQCASGCPQEIMAECRAWRRQADADIPTALLLARTEAGEDATGISVEIDGSLRSDALGAELPLTAGDHTFRFFRGTWEKVLTVKISPGEKRRQIRVTVPADEATSPSPQEAKDPLRPLTVTAFTLGSAGFAVALIGFVGGITMKSTLEACAPGCDTTQTDRAHRYLTAADVGLIVGGVGAVTGIVLVTTAKGRKAKRAASLQLLPLGFGLGASAHGYF